MLNLIFDLVTVGRQCPGRAASSASALTGRLSEAPGTSGPRVDARQCRRRRRRDDRRAAPLRFHPFARERQERLERAEKSLLRAPRRRSLARIPCPAENTRKGSCAGAAGATGAGAASNGSSASIDLREGLHLYQRVGRRRGELRRDGIEQARLILLRALARRRAGCRCCDCAWPRFAMLKTFERAALIVVLRLNVLRPSPSLQDRFRKVPVPQFWRR